MTLPDAMDTGLDKLYRAPLSEFVSTRNALATALKKAGDAEGAKRVKSLVKPSVSAWAVNQLFWKEPLSFDALIAAGDRCRKVVSEQGVREDAERERLEAVRDATRIVRALLETSAESASAAVLRRVETTLDSLASYGSANPDPMDGRLTRDLEPPGFAAFAALAPPPPPVQQPKPEPLPEPPDLVARAEERVSEREAALDETRAAMDAAITRMDGLTEQLERLHEHITRAERNVEEAEIAIVEKKRLVEESKVQLEEARVESEAKERGGSVGK